MLVSQTQWCLAAELYKYKDANGRWVFTDKKPQAVSYEKSQLLFTEASVKVSVINRGSEDRPILYAVNQLAGPAQIWLKMLRQENVHFYPSNATEWIILGPKEQFLTNLSPLDNTRSWAYQWQVMVVRGQPIDVNTIDTAPILTPFKGGPFVISQSFHGRVSHNQHPESFYAVDIPMPEGTPIRAVREGIIMDLERNYSRAGWREEYADEANFVRILHGDNSMALYAHLKPDSMTVAVGQRVGAGDILAVSGNTGFSSGPHLHFAIQYNAGHELQSAPFQFAGFSREPKEGDVLR